MLMAQFSLSIDAQTIKVPDGEFPAQRQETPAADFLSSFSG